MATTAAPARPSRAAARDLPAPTLLTDHQAARYLGVGRRSVHRLAAGGALPTVRIGRSVRFAMADLDAFIAASRSAS